MLSGSWRTYHYMHICHVAYLKVTNMLAKTFKIICSKLCWSFVTPKVDSSSNRYRIEKLHTNKRWI